MLPLPTSARSFLLCLKVLLWKQRFCSLLDTRPDLMQGVLLCEYIFDAMATQAEGRMAISCNHDDLVPALEDLLSDMESALTQASAPPGPDAFPQASTPVSGN